jgi:CheY-like chemotaxis protein
VNLTDAVILLVDDEPHLLEIFVFWLTSAGCRNLHTAANGEAALALLRIVSIDLLVTDIRMPIMDGITLVRQLGLLTGLVPSIVFVSGFGDVDQREMYDLGVAAFLSKPLLREDFIGALEKSLADRISLWLDPMKVRPRQAIVVEAEPNDESKGRNFFQLGRGGFSARYPGPAKLGKVSFRCFLSAEHQEISGEGYVRWFSRTQQAIGIEFVFIDIGCRSWLLETIDAINPRSYIPNFDGLG